MIAHHLYTFIIEYMLERVTIVLVSPSHPGNIGAVARSMKTMGVSKLVLVAPKRFPSAQATERAASADDILHKARVVDTLEAALEGKHWVIAASARNRYLQWPMVAPAELADLFESEYAVGQVAVVFGRENSGLTNEELRLCHKHVCIPANPQYSSLNLAMAVQLICYELRMKSLQSKDGQITNITASSKVKKTAELATIENMERFYQHLQRTTESIGFLDPAKPKLLMSRLRRLFNRAKPDNAELNILRGILKSVDDAISANTTGERK